MWTVYADEPNPCIGLDTEEAAETILRDDLRDYEIRREDGEFVLYHSERGGGGNIPKRRTKFTSAANTLKEAQKEIFQRVIWESEECFGVACVADADYEELFK